MARNTEANFSLEIVRELADKVGHRCSNPSCRRPTTAGLGDRGKPRRIGDGAHKHAASPNATRGDENKTVGELSAY